MGTFPEAEARMYDNIYVCRKCESKTRIAISKVLAGKAQCRKCSSKHMRPVRKRSKK